VEIRGHSQRGPVSMRLMKRDVWLLGVPTNFSAAIRRGADIRIHTEFRHNEHIEATSTDPELIREVADFCVTYLLDDRWGRNLPSSATSFLARVKLVRDVQRESLARFRPT
jgi:hypothetical protein